jgi:hypothetical protein
MVNEPIKQYAVIPVTRYDRHTNGYYSYNMKVFHIREHALEYLNAMNTASKYDEGDNVEYLLYVYEPEPNTK